MRSFGRVTTDTLESLVLDMLKMSEQLQDDLVSTFNGIEIRVSPEDEFGSVIKKYYEAKRAVTVGSG